MTYTKIWHVPKIKGLYIQKNYSEKSISRTSGALNEGAPGSTGMVLNIEAYSIISIRLYLYGV